jgi:hypothetical protein
MGETRRYVEVLDYDLNTDSAYYATSVEGRAVWTDLWHLEGRLCDIVADGAVMSQQVVTGGTITLPRNANVIEIGLHYESTLVDLPVEITTREGSAFGSAVSVHEIIVSLYDSMGLTINGEVIPFRQFGIDNFNAVIPYTGQKTVSNIDGWEGGGVVTIKQTQPLPCTILSIIKRVSING